MVHNETMLELARALYANTEPIYQHVIYPRKEKKYVKDLAAALLIAERVLHEAGQRTQLDVVKRGEFTMAQIIAWKTNFGTLPEAFITGPEESDAS